MIHNRCGICLGPMMGLSLLLSVQADVRPVYAQDQFAGDSLTLAAI